MQGDASAIKLYNTKSRKIEDFKPIEKGKVSIYSCGPTVYHFQHLGNMRAAVFADSLRKMFVSAHYDVKHVINITDVGHNTDDGDYGEDKMEKGSKREGKTVFEIAEMYTDAYFKDLERLNIFLKDYIFPRATDHIGDQIALIRKLEEKGFTYTITDGVYFDTSKFKDYASFANLNIEGLKSGARVEENKEKRNITDFALWKFSKPEEKRQMEWESPWGKGFPGWHIECSAMSMKYLGEYFDIHTGGIEHIPVHHTNEIAQSTCATGKKYVNFWMHNNHLQDTTGKMAKSKGEFLTLSSLIEKNYNPIAFRYFLLTTHYRKEMSFSFDALDAASVAYDRLFSFAEENKTEKGKVNEKYKEEFLNCLFNDLNTPESIAIIWKFMKDSTVSNEDKYATLINFSAVLGLGLHEAEKEKIKTSKIVRDLIKERGLARKENNWGESDKLREEIKKLGFGVRDTDDGQIIEKIEIKKGQA